MGEAGQGLTAWPGGSPNVPFSSTWPGLFRLMPTWPTPYSFGLITSS